MKPYLFRVLGISILFVFFTSSLSGQAKKGNKYAKRKDWPAAEEAYRAHLNHAKYAAAARLGLAQVLTHSKAPSYPNILEAIQLANAADSIFQTLTRKQQNKLRKLDCTRPKVNKTRADIVKKAMIDLNKQGDILAYDAFIEVMGEPIRSTRSTRENTRADLVKQALENLGRLDYASCTSLVKNHSDLLRKNNLKFKNQLDSRLYRTFVNEYGFDQLDRFKSDHPQHWVSMDCWLDEFVAAIKKPGAGALLQFLNTYPLTILATVAQEEINGRTMSNRSDLNAEELDQLTELENNQELRNSLSRSDPDELMPAALLPVIQQGAPSTRAYVLLQKSVDFFLTNKQWDKALEMLQTAQEWFPDGQPEGCTTRYTFYHEKQGWFTAAIDIVSKPSESIELVPITELNTFREEISPVIDVSGDILFYATFNSENYTTDIYRSAFDYEKKQWQSPKRVDALSSDLNEAPLSLTADGNTMLLFRDGKLFLSERRKEGWSKPDSLTSAVNGFPWIGRAVLSADGQRLIFAASNEALESYRKSDIDLFLATKQSNGKFGDPVPLSSTLNTEDEDRSPFLHHDMKTLYFSSDGHPGLGENDVFVSRRLDDTWTNWSPPENLGKEINTMDNDWGYNLSLSPSGAIAYLSSDNLAGYYQSDLFTTGLPKHLKPEPQRTIIGRIKNSSEQDIPTGTLVIIRTTDTKEEICRTETRADGTFKYIIPDTSLQVEYVVVHQTLFPNVEKININREEEVTRLQDKAVVALPDMLKGDVPAPIDVNFPQNSNVLDTLSYASLDLLYNMVNNKPYFISLSGHTDNEGSATHNQQLSENRARSVYDYLLSKGIPEDRMEAVGYGFTKPVADNDDEKGRAANRRVEVRLSVIKTDE